MFRHLRKPCALYVKQVPWLSMSQGIYTFISIIFVLSPHLNDMLLFVFVLVFLFMSMIVLVFACLNPSVFLKNHVCICLQADVVSVLKAAVSATPLGTINNKLNCSK